MDDILSRGSVHDDADYKRGDSKHDKLADKDGSKT
jgi:hypothetical protein